MRKFLYRFFCVILIALGIWLIAYSQSTLSITLATFLFIGGVSLWIASSPESYNKTVDQIKMIGGAEHIDIEKMQRDFADFETPLGKPWVSKIKMVPGKCMIFGPNVSGEYIYLYKSNNKQNLMLGYNELPSFIKPSPKDEWRLSPEEKPNEEPEEMLCDLMQSAYLIDDLLGVFKKYVREGKVENKNFNQEKGHIYQFNEQFKLAGQSFMLCDLDEHPIYKVEGTMPLKTLKIYDAKTDELIFTLSKRILHVLPHYDFYYKGQPYGSFEKKLDLTHNYFTMQTEDGLVEMRSVEASFGDNYRIKVNGAFVGCISENLELSIHNFIFDNMVIYVKNKSYLPLMTALAVMAAREMARNDEDN